MKKLKAIIQILKLLQIGLDTKDFVKIEKEMREFYTRTGVL